MDRQVLGRTLAQPPLPVSPAIQAGNWVFISGQLATDYEAGVAPAAAILNLERPSRGESDYLPRALMLSKHDIYNDKALLPIDIFG